MGSQESDTTEHACTVVKNLPANAGDTGLIPGSIPWRRKWLPTAVFLPGKSHGQRSLAGYNSFIHSVAIY